MSLKGYLFKKVTVTALYVCNITCSGETKCRIFNYVIVEKSWLKHSGKKRIKAREFPTRLFTFLHCLRQWQKYIISLVHSIFIFLSDFLIKKPSTFKEWMVFDCFVDKYSQIPYLLNSYWLLANICYRSLILTAKVANAVLLWKWRF